MADQWIKCSERMPEQGQLCWVALKKRVEPAEWWMTQKGVHDAPDGWCSLRSFGDDDLDFIPTHWMPAPEPPEVKP